MANLEPRTIGFRLLSLLGLKGELARRLAPLGMILLVLALLGALWATWQAFDWFNDRDAVDRAATRANVEFQKDKDEAAGRADVGSAERGITHREKVKQTEELIDEALEQGCVVADYLASNGTLCLRPATVSRPPAE
jgi:hypothetical protein